MRRGGQARGQARGEVGDALTRSRANRRDRAIARRTRRRRPAAPARCRCCWWPSRGGCAARGSAAPAAARAGRRCRCWCRPAGRAADAGARQRTAMYAACGPPNQSGSPKRWVLPTATSAPASPGGVSSVSASRSAATTSSAPASCTLAASGARSTIRPDVPGYCASTPKAPARSRLGRPGRPRRP